VENRDKTRMNTGESAWSSDSNFWRPGSLHSAPINTFKKHRKLRPAEPHRATLGLRPDESAALKPLGEETQTVSVPPKKFYDVASPSAKYENMSREWLLLKHGLDLSAQPIEAAAHVGHACGNPYPGSGRKLDHWRKLSRMERNKAGSEPLSTQIIVPPGSWMWIVPPLVACSSADLSGVSLASSPGVVTDTGSRAQGSNSSPRSKARRHLNT
jgi:hypothetical protein